MTTIKDVAREAGVSLGTVSNVLNGRESVKPENREKVLKAIKKLRFHYRNLLGGLYRENPVKSRNYEAVKSSKKWENVGNSYIIPALLLYRYSYI